MAQNNITAGLARRVLVFGSINIDLVCQAERIPGAGETVLAPSYEFFAGGKGANQAVAAARAGASVVMVGAVGKDAFAEIPLQALRQAGVETHSIHVVDAPTGAAFITISRDGENAITVASGANRLVRADMIGAENWAASGICVIQGELSWPEAYAAAQMAQARGLAVILNAAPSHGFDARIMPHVDFLIVNAHEMADIAGQCGISSDNFPGFSEKILQKPGSACLITRGSEGVAFYSAAQQFSVAARPVAVVDTTGAGDTFCGVFAAMLAQARSVQDAVDLANTAAGLACMQRGAQSAMPALAAIEAAASQAA